MAPYVRKYVRPEEAAQSRAQMIRRLIGVAAAIPIAFVFLAYGYSDQAPAGLRNAIIADARHHYELHGATEFVHSTSGLRRLKDEFDKVASHNEHHLGHVRMALADRRA